MSAAIAAKSPMPSDDPIAMRGGTRRMYTRAAMMNAIPPIPTMPPRKPRTSAIGIATRGSARTSSALSWRGVTGSSSMIPPAKARNAKTMRMTLSGVSRETNAPTSDATALGGPMSQTRRVDTLPYARWRSVPSTLPEMA